MIEKLTKRAEFLAAARSLRSSTPGFTLQARRRTSEHPPDASPAPDTIRVGFTCSKKVGNAVARNRAKRRLREVARLGLPRLGCSGWDYVLIGRRGVTASRSFESLVEDLERALRTIHSSDTQRQRP